MALPDEEWYDRVLGTRLDPHNVIQTEPPSTADAVYLERAFFENLKGHATRQR